MIFEVLYLLGRDAPMAVTALGWALLICGGWALSWVLGAWGGRS